MRESNIGHELKDMAQEVVRFGERCVQAGRDWLNERRDEMNNRNDDDRREHRPGQYGQARARHGYGDQSESGRARQQTQGQGNTGRGEYYGGAQFSERTQGAGWDEERGSWDYEGGPERYSASGSGENTEQAYRQQGGRQSGARTQYGSQREYGNQGSGSSDYYRGRQGHGAQGSFGSEFNTYGRNQGYGEGSGYTRSNQPRSQQGSQFGSSQDYGDRSSLQSGSQDYLDEGEMSGYGSRGSGSPQYGSTSGRYGTAPGQYGYGGQRSYRGVGPKNYTRSDVRLAEDINERLTDDEDLDATEIMVRVADGKVTLEGQVDQRWMKHRAEDLADACTGVKEVDNRILVTSTGSRLEQGAGTRAPGARTSQATGTTTGTSGGASGTTPH